MNKLNHAFLSFGTFFAIKGKKILTHKELTLEIDLIQWELKGLTRRGFFLYACVIDSCILRFDPLGMGFVHASKEEHQNKK